MVRTCSQLCKAYQFLYCACMGLKYLRPSKGDAWCMCWHGKGAGILGGKTKDEEAPCNFLLAPGSRWIENFVTFTGYSPESNPKWFNSR